MCSLYGDVFEEIKYQTDMMMMMCDDAQINVNETIDGVVLHIKAIKKIIISKWKIILLH